MKEGRITHFFVSNNLSCIARSNYLGAYHYRYNLGESTVSTKFQLFTGRGKRRSLEGQSAPVEWKWPLQLTCYPRP